MRLPRPRGPLGSALVAALGQERTTTLVVPDISTGDRGHDVVHDDDFQLALWIGYELAYRGFDEVDDSWEWDPALVAWRAVLEARWLAALRDLVGPVPEVDADRVPAALSELVSADAGPPLAGYLQRSATIEQYREFVATRSVYHLKEADPHSWAIPRLGGRTKAALIEIQADEYGGGRPNRMHSTLFASTMRALGLDDSYGHFVDQSPAAVLAVSNTMSLFGLHRSHTGALLGHLGAFEMTSSLPNRRYGNGLRRLGYGTDATRFYDEHITADAVHEQIAAHDLCGSFALDHPSRGAEILFGASCALAVESCCGNLLLHRWKSGRAVLRAVEPRTTAA